MSNKSITIDPSLFAVGGNKRAGRKSKKTVQEKEKTKEMLMSVSNKSVKDILLAKLKAYKKNKQNTMKKPIQQENNRVNEDFLHKLKKRKNQTAKNVNMEMPNFSPSNHISPQTTSYHIDPSLPSPTQMSFQPHINTSSTNHPVPERPKFGILKNGTQPTIRTYRNTMKNLFRNKQPEHEEERVHLKVERKLNVGRNKTLKKCGVFIKSNVEKSKIDSYKTEMRNTHIRTVKNYLKNKNLIKYGTQAPQPLLREIYETSNLLGGVENQNSKVLVENYLENDSTVV